MPNYLNSGGPSFLGPSYGPFVIEADPAAPEFAVRDIALPVGVTGDRSHFGHLFGKEVDGLNACVHCRIDVFMFYLKTGYLTFECCAFFV